MQHRKHRLNLNTYAANNPLFNEKVVEKLVAISHKSAEYTTGEESRLVASVLNSFHVFKSIHPKLRELVTRDIEICMMEKGETICKNGEIATSVFLLLSGKVRMFKPFEMAENKEKIKKNSVVGSVLGPGTDNAENGGEDDDPLEPVANSGTIMELGEKNACESIDSHILEPDGKWPTSYFVDPENFVWHRKASGIALESGVMAVVHVDAYNRAKEDYLRTQIEERFDVVQNLNGFGKHAFRFFALEEEDVKTLKAFLNTWKVVLYKANTVITRERHRVDRVILIKRGKCRSFRRARVCVSGLMEVSNGARTNIPLYKLTYQASLCTHANLCEVFEIPADAFYNICVHPKHGKRMVNFCAKYFQVEFLSDTKNVNSLNEIKSWHKRKTAICKANVGTTKANKKAPEVEQEPPSRRGESRENILEKMQMRVTKDIDEWKAKKMTISMSVPQLSGKQKKKKRRRRKRSKTREKTQALPALSSSAVSKLEKQLQSFKNGAMASYSSSLSSLPRIISKEQQEKNKARNKQASAQYLNRMKFGRKYDSTALRYWNPAKD
eukprot:g5157.t1